MAAPSFGVIWTVIFIYNVGYAHAAVRKLRDNDVHAPHELLGEYILTETVDGTSRIDAHVSTNHDIIKRSSVSRSEWTPTYTDQREYHEMLTNRHHRRRQKRQDLVTTPTYSDDDITRLLDYHNTLRRQEMASDMLRMVSA